MINTNTQIWSEKYRPTILDDICNQDNIINSLKNILITKNLPHLIFYGPSGTGKTSTIQALVKYIFGVNYSNHIFEFNASEDRGINIIRDKIKLYAKQSINTNTNIPPWKIIILDDADTLTQDAQYALRRIIEQYSNITRFCIIFNNINKIIGPIFSRFAVYRFKPIQNINIYNRLKYIIEKEQITVSETLINKIITISDNDLRKAINLLQTYDSNIDLLSGYYPDINIIFTYILNKDTENINIFINNFFNNGYSLSLQLKLIFDYILNMDLECNIKGQILNIIIDVDQSLNKGCDEYINFMKIIYFMLIVIP